MKIIFFKTIIHAILFLSQSDISKTQATRAKKKVKENFKYSIPRDATIYVPKLF